MATNITEKPDSRERPANFKQIKQIQCTKETRWKKPQ